MHEAKLAYRPLPHDDWGFIRTESGDLFATVRRPLDDDEAAAHRSAGTDPFEPLALALIAAAGPLEEIGPPTDLVAFAKLCIETARQGGSLEGIEIQEAAFKFGLLEQAPFDPALHVDPDGCAKAGDAWFDYSRAFRFITLELGVLRDLRPFIGRRMTPELINDMAAALAARAVGRSAPARTNPTKEETPVEQAFSGWAIVELMGHRTRPGRVKEVELAGSKMLQVDIPVSDVDFVSEFYSAPALYSLRPCTEEIAREKANYSYLDPRPVRPLDYRPREAIEDDRHRGSEEAGETGSAD